MRLLIEFAREKTESNMARLADAKDSLGDLTEIEREVTEIDALVSDLLASSRIDFTALTASKLDAIAVGKTALERAAVDASRLAAPSDPIEFEGDATLVARAVSNLLENAKRHAGGVEALRIESRPGFVSFVVEDNGPGFAPGEETARFRAVLQGAVFGCRRTRRVGGARARAGQEDRRSPRRPRLRREPRKGWRPRGGLFRELETFGSPPSARPRHFA